MWVWCQHWPCSFPCSGSLPPSGWVSLSYCFQSTTYICPKALDGFPLPKGIHLQHLLEITVPISCPPPTVDPWFWPLGILQDFLDSGYFPTWETLPFLAQILSPLKVNQVLPFLFFKNKFIYLFTFGCGGFSLLGEGFLQLRCAGFLLWWLILLQSTGSKREGFSSCGSRALEHRLSSCGTQAQLLCGMWDLPGPGLELLSPALAGGLLTTAPPGESLISVLSAYNCW